MIVIDSSALIAILRDEPERDRFINAIVDYGSPRISSGTYVEATMVMQLRWGDRGGRELDALIDEVGIEIIAFDHDQAKAARDGLRRYGKGLHRAPLNFGDCFTYALAKTLDVPLLSKGDDFALTDVKRAF